MRGLGKRVVGRGGCMTLTQRSTHGAATTLLAALQDKPRVLVVDDQPVHLQVLHQLFADEYHVFVATNGPRALEICRDTPPDLVLLDVVMPGMDGYEVCARMKAHEALRDIPIIFLTAHSDASEETRGLEAGAVDFIAKPINPAVVRARVRTHVTLKRQADSIRKMVFLDGLTGVYNRRYLDQQLPIEMARSRRSGMPLSLLVVDIDCFKDYNDHYGHQAGDDCLRLVARCLQGTFRRSADLLARYGGEEFVGVLPETAFDTAMELAWQLEGQVRTLRIPHARSLAADCITVSVGVSTRDARADWDEVALFERADAQLYEAKRAGRGRVCGVVLDSADAPASRA